jgi:integrase
LDEKEVHMPVEYRRTSDWWYGRYEVDGRRRCVNLRVRVRGQRPGVDNDNLGDAVFHASKQTAEEKLKEVAAEARSPAGAARLIERIYELKTGITVSRIPIADLAKEWNSLPRRRAPSPAHLEQCRLIFSRFEKFLADRFPEIHDLSRVTPKVARAFLEFDAARGISAKTWNDHLVLMRSVCRKLLPDGAINPFAGIPTKVVEPIFRQPFSPEELSEILRVAEADPEFRPVIITGMCTAMRRGDCCTLKWKDVDLANGFLNVKTAKTGQTVAIPIFPLLRTELESRKGQGGEYVFPSIAAEYKRIPLNITRRIRRVLAAAGFVDEDTRPVGTRGPKRKRPVVIRGGVTVAREEGKGRNRVSIRDFHSFRVTWVTLALTAGVPLELVQRVTGHKTTDIVLKHYFQPGREAFRAALYKVMPDLLTSGSAETPVAALRKAASALTPQNVAARLPRILAMIDALHSPLSISASLR